MLDKMNGNRVYVNMRKMQNQNRLTV